MLAGGEAGPLLPAVGLPALAAFVALVLLAACRRQLAKPSTALSAAPAAPAVCCVQEVTPLIAQLFRGSPWWQSYCSSPCPAGAPYFTMLLWKKSSVQGPSGYAELPFENSIMGGWVGGWVGAWVRAGGM